MPGHAAYPATPYKDTATRLTEDRVNYQAVFYQQVLHSLAGLQGRFQT